MTKDSVSELEGPYIDGTGQKRWKKPERFFPDHPDIRKERKALVREGLEAAIESGQMELGRPKKPRSSGEKRELLLWWFATDPKARGHKTLAEIEKSLAIPPRTATRWRLEPQWGDDLWRVGLKVLAEKLPLVLLQLAQRALQGDIRAIRLVLQLCRGSEIPSEQVPQMVVFQKQELGEAVQGVAKMKVIDGETSQRH